MPYAIRPAEPRDLPQLGKLAGALVRMHHALHPERFLLVEGIEEGYERFLGSELQNQNVVLLVAVQGGEVVGYVYARNEPRDWMRLLDAHGELHDVFVAPSARRLGLGRALVQAGLRALAAKGTRTVVLNTAASNEGAHALFKSLGFAPTMIEMCKSGLEPTPRADLERT